MLFNNFNQLHQIQVNKQLCNKKLYLYHCLVPQIVKNKCAAPYKLAEFDILFGSGISGAGCILDAAEAVDVIQKKGSWYSYGETRLGQGREKTLAMLQENPEMLQCALESPSHAITEATITMTLFHNVLCLWGLSISSKVAGLG